MKIKVECKGYSIETAVVSIICDNDRLLIVTPDNGTTKIPVREIESVSFTVDGVAIPPLPFVSMQDVEDFFKDI